MAEPAGCVLGVVGEDHAGAGALNAGENFHDHALLVDPAIARRGFDHGVFAADVVSADGHVKFLAHALNDIEIRKRRLDHDHVGAFVKIRGNFAECFASIGRIHLVAAAIAKLRRGLGGLAKWAVEAGTIFGGVGKNGDVFELVLVEFGANGGDAAVHHVRRRDDVGASARVGQGFARKELQRFIVEDFTVANHATMAMAGVFAHADVGDDQQFQIGVPNSVDGALNGSIVSPSLGALFIFFLRQAKQNNSGQAELFDFAAFFDEFIDRLLVDAGHGADFGAHIFAGADEHWGDKSGAAEARFANQAAESFGAPQSTRAMNRECHECTSGAEKHAAIASARPSAVDFCASMATAQPESRMACAVVGPMAAKRLLCDNWWSASGGMSSVKL